MFPYQNMAREVPEINAMKCLEKKRDFPQVDIVLSSLFKTKDDFQKNEIKQRVLEVCL